MQLIVHTPVKGLETDSVFKLLPATVLNSTAASALVLGGGSHLTQSAFSFSSLDS